MANRLRDVGKERWWRGTLRQQITSGLSARAFCRREKLAESAFYFWRREIAKRDAEGQGTARARQGREARSTRRASAFVRLSLLEPAPRETAIEIALAGGRTLRLPATMAAQRLAEVVHALEGG